MPPPAKVFFPARELMLMMSPEPRRIMEGATARETRKTLLRLVSRTRSQSASVFSWVGPKRPMPALLTRMVMGPRVDSVAATRSVTSAGFVTSAIWVCTGTPIFAISRADSSSAVRSRPQIETEAPSKASRGGGATPPKQQTGGPKQAQPVREGTADPAGPAGDERHTARQPLLFPGI